MKITVQKAGNCLIPVTESDCAMFARIPDGDFIEIDIPENGRTSQQNKSLHVFCGLYSDALNGAGLDMKIVLERKPTIPWSMHSFKERIWRETQKNLFGKESTTSLSTVEPTEITRAINMYFSETYGMYVDWPSNR
jgi:hypothetical protein